MRILTCLLALWCWPAYAQISIAATAQQDGKAATPVSGSNLSIAATAVGASAVLRITLQYQGSGVLTLSPPQLLGGSGFSFEQTIGSSWVLGQSGVARFAVVYLPSAGTAETTTLSLSAIERKPDATFVRGVLSFLVTGTAPSFAVHYAFSTDGNNNLVTPGSSIVFPPATVNTDTTASILVTNTGTAPGTVTGVRVSGGAYQLQNLPVIPTTVAAGADLRFNVRFAPSGTGASVGQLVIGLPQGDFAASLQATATGASVGYELVLPTTVLAVAPGDSLTFPSAEVGKSVDAILRIRNAGTADSQITAISISGPFSVTSAPVVPLTLHPAATAVIGLTFTPAEGGPANGTLRIGQDAFLLNGLGLASQLSVSFRQGNVAASGTLFLPAVQVGTSVETEVTVKNTGTLTTSVRGIQLNQTLSDLALSGLPALPTDVVPGASFSFKLTFAPHNTGVIANVLRINDATFSVSGSGTPPPPLPAYGFRGASGSLEPLQQPAVSLALSEPYALPLKGVLTLTAVSDSFAVDPSVQFATGGRTIAFQIPANSTQAVFGGGATSIRLQTGSVAESIVLAPSFALDGGYDLTPGSAPSLSLNVPRMAPRILQLQMVNQNAGSFTLLVTGMATSRAVNQITFQLQPLTGVTLSTTQISVDVRAAFDLWFSNPQSQAFGGLFSFTVPFNLNIPNPSATLSQYLDSVSATITNTEGSSVSSKVSFH